MTLVAIVFYGMVLVASAFAHHDLLCHLRNPQHCTACTASQLGSDPQTPTVAVAARLDDAGCAVAARADVSGALCSARSTGRSPPLHA